MKRLYLVRHANSSLKDAGLGDYARPLNDRGVRDAKTMGRSLKERGIEPDLILSSPAERALKTAQIIAKGIDYTEIDVITDKIIYLSSVPDLLDLIHYLDDTHDEVMILGHNPTLTDLVNFFTNYGLENLPTCGIVGATFDVLSWKSVNRGGGKVLFFEHPGSH